MSILLDSLWSVLQRCGHLEDLTFTSNMQSGMPTPESPLCNTVFPYVQLVDGTLSSTVMQSLRRVEMDLRPKPTNAQAVSNLLFSMLCITNACCNNFWDWNIWLSLDDDECACILPALLTSEEKLRAISPTSRVLDQSYAQRLHVTGQSQGWQWLKMAHFWHSMNYVANGGGFSTMLKHLVINLSISGPDDDYRTGDTTFPAFAML